MSTLQTAEPLTAGPPLGRILAVIGGSTAERLTIGDLGG